MTNYPNELKLTDRSDIVAIDDALDFALDMMIDDCGDAPDDDSYRDRCIAMIRLRSQINPVQAMNDAERLIFTYHNHFKNAESALTKMKSLICEH